MRHPAFRLQERFHTCVFVAVVLSGVVLPCALGLHVRRRGLRGLHWDAKGRLSFIQVPQEKPAPVVSDTDLYPVLVNVAIEEMRTAEGLTMVFDKKNHQMRLDQGISQVEGLAWGHFNDSIETTGWSELHLTTTESEEVSNDVKMYSVGFIEGLLTCVRMSQYYANLHELLLRRDKSAHAMHSIRDLFKDQLEYWSLKTNMVEHLMTMDPEDAYWRQARYVLLQMWGVRDGYNFAARHFSTTTLGLEDVLAMNSGGELSQLMIAYGPKAREQRAMDRRAMSFLQLSRGDNNAGIKAANAPADRLIGRAYASALKIGKVVGRGNASGESDDPLDDSHWEQRVADSGHCSAIVRLSDGNFDLLMGHTTWDDYSKMTRIFKYYKFSLGGSETIASHIAFSSYPGAVTSTDDFYIMDSGLAVMDTSLVMLDQVIWSKVLDFPNYPHIPNFVHLMVSNRMAKSAAHWARVFTSVNTGSAPAQWMVVDYNQFKAGKDLPDNIFWVVETIPGTTSSKDMSQYLRHHRYFASENRPFFSETRKASGFEDAQASHGDLYSFDENPRAKIFRGESQMSNVLYNMRRLMTQNNYPFTGVNHDEPGHEISARLDLTPGDKKLPNGGIDAKVTNNCLVAKMEAQVISGPSHQTQKPFTWKKPDGTEAWPGWPHLGLPDTWNFGYVQMTPGGATNVVDIDEC